MRYWQVHRTHFIKIIETIFRKSSPLPYLFTMTFLPSKYGNTNARTRVPKPYATDNSDEREIKCTHASAYFSKSIYECASIQIYSSTSRRLYIHACGAIHENKNACHKHHQMSTHRNIPHDTRETSCCRRT